MYLKQSLLLILTLILCFILACGSSNEFVRTSPSYERKMLQVRRIGVISDVNLSVCEGHTYCSIEDSKLIASYMLEASQSCLEQKGYQIDFRSSPSVCAFKVMDRAYQVAEKQGGNLEKQYPPFYISDFLEGQKLDSGAFLNAMRQIFSSVEQSRDSYRAILMSDMMTQSFLHDLAEATKMDFFLFLFGNGVLVTPGWRLAETIIQFPLAMFGEKPEVSESFIDTYAALIDLRNGEMLWSNIGRIESKYSANIKFRKLYMNKWVPELLQSIPPK